MQGTTVRIIPYLVAKQPILGPPILRLATCQGQGSAHGPRQTPWPSRAWGNLEQASSGASAMSQYCAFTHCRHRHFKALPTIHLPSHSRQKLTRDANRWWPVARAVLEVLSCWRSGKSGKKVHSTHSDAIWARSKPSCSVPVRGLQRGRELGQWAALKPRRLGEITVVGHNHIAASQESSPHRLPPNLIYWSRQASSTVESWQPLANKQRACPPRHPAS